MIGHDCDNCIHNNDCGFQEAEAELRQIIASSSNSDTATNLANRMVEVMMANKPATVLEYVEAFTSIVVEEEDTYLELMHPVFMKMIEAAKVLNETNPKVLKAFEALRHKVFSETLNMFMAHMKEYMDKLAHGLCLDVEVRASAFREDEGKELAKHHELFPQMNPGSKLH